jgi:ankyrin repeat protein
VVRRLLEFKGGKDPDDLDRKGERKWSGLYLACESGHARIARLFLDAGADPTLADTHGKTPLDIARDNCNWRCARLLEVSGSGGGAKLSLGDVLGGGCRAQGQGQAGDSIQLVHRPVESHRHVPN